MARPPKAPEERPVLVFHAEVRVYPWEPELLAYFGQFKPGQYATAIKRSAGDLARLDAELAQLRARVAELEAQHAATPRPCVTCDTCHGVRMAEEMREACADAVRKLSRINSAYEDAIRALPLPVCKMCLSQTA